jgi:hypothetical protein
MVGHAVQNAGGHRNVPSHGTVYLGTESLPVGIEVIETSSTQRVVRIDYGMRFTDHTVAFIPTGHPLADFAYVPGKLMTQHDRIFHGPAHLSHPHVQVATTDPNMIHFEQNLVRIDRRLGKRAKLDALPFTPIVYDCQVVHLHPLS